MALTLGTRLPSVEEIAELYPVTSEHRVDEHRAETNAIIRGEDQRRLMIVGPCSAWPSEAVEQYAERLARLQEDVQDRLKLIMRCYIQKPRTTVGWSGPLSQPDPLGPVDISKGIHQCRALMQRIGKMLPLADEMLFTHNADHFSPLLSYIAVGARSAEDMEHRYLASGLDCAVGMKNPTSGDIQVGVNSVLSAQHAHIFAYNHHQAETTGNPHAHLILRGGKGGSNYDPKNMADAEKAMMAAKLANPAIVVDASHDNSVNGSGKDPELQEMVVDMVLSGIRRKRKEYQLVKGFMLESYLVGGTQKVGPATRREDIVHGKSITDPCLDWTRTEALIRHAADELDRVA